MSDTDVYLHLKIKEKDFDRFWNCGEKIEAYLKEHSPAAVKEFEKFIQYLSLKEFEEGAKKYKEQVGTYVKIIDKIDAFAKKDKRAKLPDIEYKRRNLRMVISDTVRDALKYIDKNKLTAKDKKMILIEIYKILNEHLEKKLQIKTLKQFSLYKRRIIVGHIAIGLNILKSATLSYDTNQAIANSVASSIHN